MTHFKKIWYLQKKTTLHIFLHLHPLEYPITRILIRTSLPVFGLTISSTRFRTVSVPQETQGKERLGGLGRKKLPNQGEIIETQAF